MDEKLLQKAVDDISTIKEVINRTGKSFASFSRIFIYWGILFVFYSIIGLAMSANRDQVFEIYLKYPALSFIFPVPLVALIAAVIYFAISKKMPLAGLEKHLMKVWLLVLMLNILPRRFEILSNMSGLSGQTLTVAQNSLNTLFFSLAIALIVTSLFTGFKNPMKVGFVFIAISLLDSYVRLPLDNNTLYQLIHFAAIPFTFIYTGLYLKAKQTGGTPIGN